MIEAGIPISAGLGSSAAFAACLSAAIASVANLLTGEEYETSVLDDIIADGTNYLEQLQHGQASGCDAACILQGGCIAYQLKFPPEVTEITTLQNCQFDKLNMFIVSTQKQRDTKKIVSAVRRFKESNKAEFEELIGTIGNVASELTELLQEPQLDKYSVWDYISMNQQYLQELGVSSPEIDLIVG